MERIDAEQYASLDRPEVTMFLFYPRTSARTHTGDKDRLILVEEDIVVGGKFHMCDQSGATILFFHGNGEIVDDYDDMAEMYNRAGINFIPVDYRGYGRSTGKPAVSSMMHDCHTIFDYVIRFLDEKAYRGPLSVMGRSLGSACAIELAHHYKERIDGLIIESGFAYAEPLLRLLGINAKALGFKEEEGFRNYEKIASYDNPLLIIHAEYDHIIPFSDGETLYEACPSKDKKLLRINNADHNTIFYHGANEYIHGVSNFINAIKKGHGNG